MAIVVLGALVVRAADGCTGLVAADAAGLRNLRAVHMGGHWGHNPQGIKAWRDARLVAGQALSATTVEVTVRRSASTDASGASKTSA